MSDPRKIDALIAEHVDRFTVENCRPDIWTHASHYYMAPGHLEPIPVYSTDIALAIGVLEKLRDDGKVWWAIDSGVKDLQEKESWGIQLKGRGNPPPWTAKWYDCPLPEAICRHVLHVLGVAV